MYNNYLKINISQPTTACHAVLIFDREVRKGISSWTKGWHNFQEEAIQWPVTITLFKKGSNVFLNAATFFFPFNCIRRG
jgi:hypothetical protein